MVEGAARLEVSSRYPHGTWDVPRPHMRGRALGGSFSRRGKDLLHLSYPYHPVSILWRGPGRAHAV